MFFKILPTHSLSETLFPPGGEDHKIVAFTKLFTATPAPYPGWR